MRFCLLHLSQAEVFWVVWGKNRIPASKGWCFENLAVL